MGIADGQRQREIAALGEVVTAQAEDYRITMITPGVGNGLLYTAEVLRESLPLWDNLCVYVDHPTAADRTRPGGRSVRDIAGVAFDPRWDGEGIQGVMRLFPGHAWLHDLLHTLLQARETGQPHPPVGLSADLEIVRAGEKVSKILYVYSLDIVMNPARGGAIHAKLGHPLRGKHVGLPLPLTDCHPKTERRAMTIENEEINLGTSPTRERVQLIETPGNSPLTGAGGLSPDLQAATLHACLNVLLAESGLPVPFREQIRERLKGRADWTLEELEGEIELAKRTAAKIMEPSTIQRLGQVQLVRNNVDRLQLAVNRLFGLPIPEDARDIPRLMGIRELYIMTTGDWDFQGRFYPERVRLANLTTTTLSSLVKNALNKILLASYEARSAWWKPIVWEEDFTTLNDVTWITQGGFADLPTVNEGAAYTELANPTDIEETSSFIKKGGYVGLTLEMIDRDDVQGIKSIPRRLGLAASRTLSSAISAIFTANSGVGPTLGQDSKALFHADHANLGTSALSISAWDAAVQAMFKQTEPASSKRLGLYPAFLIVPIELETTATQILGSPNLPGSPNNDINPRYQSARVIVCPDFTDANDWAAVADPREAAGVCVGYRYARAPELFVADDPLTGSMFTNDEMRIKVRFWYTVGIGEYRALYKANVA